MKRKIKIIEVPGMMLVECDGQIYGTGTKEETNHLVEKLKKQNKSKKGIAKKERNKIHSFYSRYSDSIDFIYKKAQM